MRLTRRSLIVAGAAVPSLALPAGLAAQSAALFVYDSRHLASRLAASHSGRRIDVAGQDDQLWRQFRTPFGNGPVEGVTAWSEWVVVRGLLEEQGKRLRAENRQGELFRWVMA